MEAFSVMVMSNTHGVGFVFQDNVEGCFCLSVAETGVQKAKTVSLTVFQITHV